MNKAETIKGPSCLTNAEDDEPIFVLRANDETASTIVRGWATAYRFAKGGFAAFTPAQRAKHAEAMQLADEMDAWRAARSARPGQ